MTRPRQRPTTAELLDRALDHSARCAGCAIEIFARVERPWCSATFTGSRHEVTLSAASHDAPFDAWLAGLPEAEWTLRGHLVADCSVARLPNHAPSRLVTLAFLLIAEA